MFIIKNRFLFVYMICTFLGQKSSSTFAGNSISNRPEDLRVVAQSCIACNAVIAGCKSSSWRWSEHGK